LVALGLVVLRFVHLVVNDRRRKSKLRSRKRVIGMNAARIADAGLETAWAIGASIVGGIPPLT